MSLGFMPPALEGLAKGDMEPYYLSEHRDANGQPLVSVFRAPGGRHFRCDYADGTCIALDRTGSAVWATWPETATAEDTATYLLGPTLGLLLRLRGTMCLHASAINVAGRAILLVGPSGAGKSSIAAAFAQRGRPVLSDDVAAIVERGGIFEVQAGYPRLRLWPASVEGLFGSPEALPLLTPTWDKRFLDLRTAKGGFQAQPLQLGAIYLLGPRHDAPPAVSCLPGRDTLLGLISNTCASHLLTSPLRAHEFDELARLVRAVPVRSLSPSDDLARIDQLCQLIEDDLARADVADTPTAAAVA
jgi:hypothetical protein